MWFKWKHPKFHFREKLHHVITFLIQWFFFRKWKKKTPFKNYLSIYMGNSVLLWKTPQSIMRLIFSRIHSKYAVWLTSKAAILSFTILQPFLLFTMSFILALWKTLWIILTTIRKTKNHSHHGKLVQSSFAKKIQLPSASLWFTQVHRILPWRELVCVWLHMSVGTYALS